MKLIDWTLPARTDVRRIDSIHAMRILAALHRFAETAKETLRSCRITQKNSTLRFTEEPHHTLIIHSVRYRSDAYL